MNPKRLIVLGLGFLMIAWPAYLSAQQDQDSVVDAARRAQAQKKDAPKAKMVIDNDNLDTLKGTINVVGQEPSAAEGQTNAGNKTAKPGANAAPAKDEAYWRQKFTDANKKLSDDEHELDILQREYNLMQEQFYTDPMAALKQQYSNQDLNDHRARIDDKKAMIAQDKQDISNLEDALRQAGGDPGWETGAQSSTPASSSEQSPSEAPAAPSTPAPAQQQ